MPGNTFGERFRLTTAGVSHGPLRHEDVTRAAAAGADALGRLVAAVVAGLETP